MKKKISILKKSIHIIVLLLFTTNLFLVTFKVQAEESSSTNIIRYEGHSRENVAEAVAKAHFRDSNKVILVNRDKFPDAISATNISQGEHPVLYTHSNRVSDSTIELLKTMSLDEIYILGGELSINKEVVDQLQQTTNTKVTRLAGRSRYDANVSAVEENFTQKDHVVIASGEVYSDALYGVSYANTIDAPVILTNTNKLESSTHKLLKDLGVKKATIIGGNLTVTQSVEKQLDELNITHNRIAGRNRYIGSAEVANQSYEMPQNVVIASGEVFSDALVSAPLSQKLNAPILLVRPDRMEKSVENYLINHTTSLRNIYIQGGPLTIYPTIENRVTELTTYLDNEEGPQVDGNVNEGETSEAPEDKEIDFSKVDTALFNQEMLKYVNQERALYGREALTYSSDLQRGTDARAEDLIVIEGLDVNGVGHVRPDGSDWRGAFTYLDEDDSYNRALEVEYSLGENIAQNFIDMETIEAVEAGERTLEDALAERIFNQYKRSPGHHANMIRAEYNEMATATRMLGGGWSSEVYNVQVFDSNLSNLEMMGN